MIRLPPPPPLFPYTTLFRSDPWERPYVGLQYQLSRYDELYCWHEDATGGTKLHPPSQDTAMIGAQLRPAGRVLVRSEEHTSELQSHSDLVCRLLLEKKKHPT